jgi:hypothetical protein
MYDQLHEAVELDQATLILALFPLAYQIDEDHPFLPQRRLLTYCERESIPCIDLLPSFRQYDIWHLTEHGHEVSAEAILPFLQEGQLTPGRD